MRSLSRIATTIGLIVWAGLASAQPVTVRMWMHEHPPRVPIDKSIIADFEKANPDIKVQYDVISAPEYSTKLLTAFAAGSGPDLFNNTSTLVTQYFAARILAPIDYDAAGFRRMRRRCSRNSRAGSTASASRASSTASPPRFPTGLATPTTRCGRKPGSIPNKDLPKTWEALPAVAEKLTKRDQNGVPIRRGFDFAWTIPGTFWFTPNTMIHQLGANMIDEDTYKAALDTVPHARAFQYLAGLGQQIPPRRTAIHRQPDRLSRRQTGHRVQLRHLGHPADAGCP